MNDHHLREVDQEIEQSPVTEIIGLLESTPNFIWSRDSPSRLSFFLPVWKEMGGRPSLIELRIDTLVDEEEANRIKADFAPPQTVHLKVRMVEKGFLGRPQGHLVSVLEFVEDAELKALGEKRKIPVVHQDGILGNLSLNRDSNCFEGRRRLAGLLHAVWITLPAEKDVIPELAMAIARSVWNDRHSWDRKLKKFAARELLEMKNEDWVDEGEGQDPVTEDVFRKRMRLKRIAVESDGTLVFIYGDGNLFSGHDIMVTGTLEDGPVSASI